jgi:hypothetical protein
MGETQGMNAEEVCGRAMDIALDTCVYTKKCYKFEVMNNKDPIVEGSGQEEKSCKTLKHQKEIKHILYEFNKTHSLKLFLEVAWIKN